MTFRLRVACSAADDADALVQLLEADLRLR
jgi:hypothetical protein